jgi:glycosyltransferase involved in cell wall biosynthesis
MKILVIAPTPFFSDRGTHIRILEEALALEKLGHQITIATYHIGKEINAEIETKIDVRRIRRWLFWYKKLEAGPDWQKIILDIMLIRKVFNLARTQKPDIIHGHLHEGVLIGWIVQKVLFWRDIKLVADFHGSLTGEMVSHGYLKKGLKWFFRIIEQAINSLGDYAVVSSWEGLEAIKVARKNADCEVVLDGTNLKSFQLAKSKAEIRRELELPAEKFIVGYAGGLVGNKGIDYFLGAIELILKARTDVFFLIGGFPAQVVDKFIQLRKLEASVRLISPLDYFQMPEILEACDMAVDPKDSDTLQASGKLLNYMAAGLAVVCFDKENNRNYLGAGGYFCNQRSAQGIADGIAYFLNQPEEIAKKGAMNKNKAQEFSWDKAGNKIDVIYKNLLQK